MGCHVVVKGRAVLAEWSVTDAPCLADLDRIMSAAARAHQEAGARVVFVSRVPSQAPVPDAAFRDAMNRKMSAFLEDITQFHAVMEGTGFVNTTKRAVVSTLYLATGRRKTFFVHDRLRGVISSVPAEARQDVLDLVLAAEPHSLASIANSLGHRDAAPAHERGAGTGDTAHGVEEHQRARSNAVTKRRGV